MISAYYILKDEEEFVFSSLESILGVEPKLVKQLVVIDMGSKDGTLGKIMEALGRFKVEDFSYHYFYARDNSTHGELWFRELGLSLCDQEWVLPIDGDVCFTNNWAREALPYLGNKSVGAIYSGFVEHVGSVDYFRPDVVEPGRFLFRKHEGLHYSGGHTHHWHTHCSLFPSIKGTVVNLPQVLHLHYGYAKSNLVEKFRNNILRGDFTQKAEEISTLMESYPTTETEVIKKYLNVSVEPVKYDKELLPKSLALLPYHALVISSEGKLEGRVCL